MDLCDADDVMFPSSQSLSIFATSVTEGAAVNGVPETSFMEGSTNYLFVDGAPPAATPEPTSLFLFGSGLVGLGLALRWRTQRLARS